jgi:hypothetical protein
VQVGEGERVKFIIAALSGIIVLAIVVITVVDATSTPTASTGQCILVRRTVLPDICANSCSPPFDCTLTRRPYGVFFTQAASCMDGVIC